MCGIGANAAANENGFTIGTEPWSDKTFEICAATENGDRRAVVFEPEIENWTYTLTEFPTAKLVATKDGIKEVIGKSEEKRPAYFLKEQKIGYLNHLDQWVSQNGTLLTSFDQLQSVSGERVQPEIIPHSEKQIYKSNIELEHAAAMEKLHYEPPCTAFSVGHYNLLESSPQFDFGENNPFECDKNSGLKRSKKFDYSETFQRSVVGYVDGTSYYIKFPNGDAQAFPWTGIERLYNPDGSMICDWGEINAYAGHELIQKD